MTNYRSRGIADVTNLGEHCLAEKKNV